MIHPHQTKWSNIRYRFELIKFASAENYNVCEAPQKLPSKFFHFLGFVTSNFLIQFNSNHRKSRHNSIEEAKNWCFFCNWLIEFDPDEFSWVFTVFMSFRSLDDIQKEINWNFMMKSSLKSANGIRLVLKSCSCELFSLSNLSEASFYTPQWNFSLWHHVVSGKCQTRVTTQLIEGIVGSTWTFYQKLSKKPLKIKV